MNEEGGQFGMIVKPAGEFTLSEIARICNFHLDTCRNCRGCPFNASNGDICNIFVDAPKFLTVYKKDRLEKELRIND